MSATSPIDYRPIARRLLSTLLLTTEDFDAFCIDYFVSTYYRFTNTMDRLNRENLLLASREPAEIISNLKEKFRGNQKIIASIDQQLRELERIIILSDSPPENSRLSDLMINNLSSLHLTIRTLTEEQYRVIDFLRGHHRAAIAGCAGSGKTLVAAEKSIRLAKAGIATLMLCHNPLLAARLRNMVCGSGVEVFDFENWIRHLCQKDQVSSAAWSNYAEPTEDELSAALNSLSESSQRYDAIIVDEGQDFRELWWIIVEAALRDERHSQLYVFYDERQSLLPFRSRPWPRQSPYQLSRNCRNAGKIYRLIRRYDESAPEPDLNLASRGVVRSSSCAPRGEGAAVTQAVLQAITEVPVSALAVLTAESCPATQSVLNNLDIDITPPWSWQDTVSTYLNSAISTGALLCAKHFPQPMAARKKNYRTNTDECIPQLGSGLRPSNKDVSAVVEWATKISHQMRKLPSTPDRQNKPAAEALPHWDERGNRLYLSGRMSPEKIIEFFRQPKWADKLPKPQRVRIVAGSSAAPSRKHIPLYSVAAFKGLEADGVVFYEPAGLAAHSPLRYVAISRARLLLHLVVAAA